MIISGDVTPVRKPRIGSDRDLIRCQQDLETGNTDPDRKDRTRLTDSAKALFRFVRNEIAITSSLNPQVPLPEEP